MIRTERRAYDPTQHYAYAVIAARYQDGWLWVRRRDRATYEIPGGHWEPGEQIEDTARRELYEETGALDFALRPVCAYSVTSDGSTDYGMLYLAQVHTLGPLPPSEIGEVTVRAQMPEALTYPQIQPYLMRWAQEMITGRQSP